jgi:hypothetical protein
MSTGYTYEVAEGKVTQLPEFALRCARAIGYLVEMRDMSPDAEIPERVEPRTDYYRERLQENVKELASVVSWDAETAEEEARKANQRMLKGFLQSIRSQKDTKARYTNMLGQVEAWEPPTPEHEGLKEFMGEQLTSSIDHDCYYLKKDYLGDDVRPQPVSGEEYRQQKLETLSRSLQFDLEHLSNVEDRTESRNEWVSVLFESLGVQHGTAQSNADTLR